MKMQGSQDKVGQKARSWKAPEVQTSFISEPDKDGTGRHRAQTLGSKEESL